MARKVEAKSNKSVVVLERKVVQGFEDSWSPGPPMQPVAPKRASAVAFLVTYQPTP